MASAQQDEYSLKIADYVVFCASFVFTMAIGIWYAFRGQGSKSRESYFLGNRKMHFIPVALSLVVTFESSIAMLGIPTEIYLYGTATIMIAFGQLIGGYMTNFVSVPMFKPMKIRSVFEYLELRFDSRRIRICGVVMCILSFSIYAGVVLFAQAVALEAVMGLNMWLSIIVMDACAIFYTSLGGIKSVVWTDVFQSFIMLGGIFAIIVKGTMETGGTLKVWELARTGKRLDTFDFDPDPTIRHSVWCAFLPSVITSSRSWFSQPSVQRILAAKTQKEATYMINIAIVGFFFVYLLISYEGLVVYAFYSEKGNEPITCGLIRNPNQIIPYTVLILFENLPGMSGLFLAALYSASLSTVSSILNSLSILVTEDVLEPWLKDAPDARATCYAKISVVFLGVGFLIFCFMVSFIEGPFSQIVNSALASAGGPLLGIFIMAAFFPSTHSKGVYVGVLVGFIISSTFTFGGNFGENVKKTPFLPLGNGSCANFDDVTESNMSDVFWNNFTTSTITPLSSASTLNATTSDPSASEDYNTLFSISYVLFAPIGVVTTVLVGVLASHLIGRNQPGDVDPRYILPISDSILFFLPPPIRRWLKALGPQFEKGWKEHEVTKDAELETLPVA